MKRFYKRCIIQGYKGLDSAQMIEGKVPILRSSGQVLVKVHSTSMNPLDKRMADGYGQEVLNSVRKLEAECLSEPKKSEFPLVLGRDFSGVVIDTTDNKYKVGDEVFGASFPTKMGSHQELVVVDTNSLVHKPKNIHHSDASCVPYAGLTAWAALVTTGGLLSSPKGSCRVLVLGAGGGVGYLATQLALHHQAEVIGVAGPEYEEHVKATGAQYLNYKQDNYARDLISLSGFDIVLDCAGFGSKSADLAPLLRTRGCVVTLDSPLLKLTDAQGLMAGGVNTMLELLESNLKTVGNGQTIRWAYFAPNKQALQKMSDLLAGGELKPLISKSYPFSDILTAYKDFQHEKQKGKVVINM
eukprot:TRINITY_DN2014_c0_g1_i14.p1 TRINITY_DN2014_c0_g1~~TRINITY_DN2014_c0_g1_i14.p1  ORF type:complete len:356 (+),score=26.85 TRINITY_DN2014_c0_g1_i14:39-1106(+)